MPLLEASTLVKTYRLGRVEVPVLRGASISVEEGECVAILGASGSGKSTMLHILGGLDRPDVPGKGRRCAKCRYDTHGLTGTTCPECGRVLESGHVGNTILYDGRNLASYSAAELDRYRNRTVGFVFQFYHLLPELNVLQNAVLPAMVGVGRFGWSRIASDVRSRASQLLDRFGLSHRLNHRSVELSGGERQRVAIARALINRPRLLLADEPTGNLDAATGGAILDAMMGLRGETKQTMVIVTHDERVAARADRVVRLKDGVVE
ncbi:MAG: ABC transporter ATP-binding protein [Phycisphaerales bacterium]